MRHILAFLCLAITQIAGAQTTGLPVLKRYIGNDKALFAHQGKEYVQDLKTGNRLWAETINNLPQVKAEPQVYVQKNELIFRTADTSYSVLSNAGNIKNPTLSPDGQFVAFTKNNDLYTVEVASKQEKRLTTDGSDVILNGYASWVYMEEILTRASRYRAFWWSPDSRNLAFFRSDDSQVPEFVMSDANGLHGYVEKLRYPKVGDKNPAVKVGIVPPTGGSIIWADFNENDDQYFGIPYWMPDGKKLLVQWMNRLQNNLKIYSVDITNGSKLLFLEETQNTWINLDDLSRIEFLKNSNQFLYQSDASGYNHIFLYGNDGKMVTPLTSGNYTVTDIKAVDEKNKWVYYTARGLENSTRVDLYRVSFNGKKRNRLTQGNLHNTFISASPDNSYIVFRGESISQPPQLYSVNAKTLAVTTLANSKDEKFDFASLPKTEIVRVKSSDGLFDLPMRITWPKNMQPGKKYPVLISIYGGPNAGTVWDNFSASKEMIQFANEGLIQVAMDHRGSGQFGKKGTNYMYHDLGNWELKDYATMVDWLIQNGQADPTKIGITGFSYGGYLSSLAVTKFPQTFTHAIAGGSVTDWTLYDSHYTERFMGTPANNPQGYKTSSVLNYADQYTGKLLLVHGIIDENVHLQNTIQLATELQKKNKFFDLMIYSGGRHGWGNLPAQWQHYLNLKNRFIFQHLLGKEMK